MKSRIERLTMVTRNNVLDNINIIGQLFPNTLTEVIRGYDYSGLPIIEKAIDFDILRQELSDSLIEGPVERYQMNWPDKRKAMLLANTPTTMTLRPCREESYRFSDTSNVYIEGNNLEVLKLLQETYLNKVKIIYIDPPYNVGGDRFVYDDNFKITEKKFSEMSGSYDEDGNVIFDIRENNESNGKFHTDWLNMMYPRIKISKDLLTENGIMFISIDDKEVDNLRKICNEIFGETNFIGTITWEKRTKAQNTTTAKRQFQSKTEYILVYKKTNFKPQFNLEITGEKIYDKEDEKGRYRERLIEEMSAVGMRGRETMIFPIIGILPREGKQWQIGLEQVNNYINRGDIFIKEDRPYVKMRPEDEDTEKHAPFWSHFFDKDVYGTAETGKAELSEILGTKNHGFETVKPSKLIKKLLFHVKETNGITLDKDDIILDFFSGSATTAQAIMELNNEDGGKRKFIMVQIPEKIDNVDNPYATICEIGKDRIRRVGKEIIQNCSTNDVGFRVFKLDTSNMKEVYYKPNEYTQATLGEVQQNIKPDRTPEDLLFQVMLELGELLSSDIEEQVIAGKKVFVVGQGNIVACFDTGVTNEVVTAIAKMQPYYAVFRDSSIATDSVAANFEQIFTTYSPTTIKKVL